ncbi:class II aldolase/adducin family protein [Limobrevibacterium gyesilva]|uniref:Class II aldolase/adducin family protein n=1 Tax=Limobrevibacterium gyesilva TaxID=2991712 RepID=A0AA41YQX6_9PROT|nr:class II aldolase/adducin family protein [Limobrevibacterium gyesilva]MCW3477086.1 class II aldolase/adducin family protein [Limobrevibacterium gyesilva]
MPDTHVTDNVRARVSEAEWQARLDCAACYRLLPIFGMSDLVYNHVTTRIPGDGERFLINPFGWMYEEITASSLITIDLAGNTVFNPHQGIGINYAGYVIHSAVHGARPDVGCVIHTHTRAGMAVSAMQCGLLPLTQTAMRCMPVACHAYEGPAVELDERARLVGDLGAANFMILRNHGLLTCGPSTAEAFNSMYWLEMACRAQVDAMAARTELTMPGADVVERSIHLYDPRTRRPFGLLEWPAMLRLLDRRDPSWRS